MALVVRQTPAAAFTDNATTCPISFSSLPLSGSLIVVLVSDYDGTGTISCADNQSNTYTQASSVAAGQNRQTIFYARNIGSPSGTFTATVTCSTAGHYFCLGAAEVTGAETGTTCLDQIATATGNNTNATITSPTLSQTNEIVFAVTGDTGSDADHGYDRPAATAFNVVMTNNDGTTHQVGVGDSKIVSATTAVTCNWGTLAATYSWGAALATFRESTASGTTLTVENASLAFTGQSVLEDQAVIITNGTLSLTGSDVTLLTGLGLTVTEGALTLSGQDVQLLANQNFVLPVTNAVLTLEGQDVPFQLAVPWTEAALTLTGQDITLVAGVAFTLVVDNGVLAFTGQDVVLFLDEDFILPVTSATITLQGQDVTLSALTSLTLDVTSANLTLTGQDVGLFTQYTTSGGGARRCRKRAAIRILSFGR